jgi:hypothetical protein
MPAYYGCAKCETELPSNESLSLVFIYLGFCHFARLWPGGIWYLDKVEDLDRIVRHATDCLGHPWYMLMEPEDCNCNLTRQFNQRYSGPVEVAFLPGDPDDKFIQATFQNGAFRVTTSLGKGKKVDLSVRQLWRYCDTPNFVISHSTESPPASTGLDHGSRWQREQAT